MFSVTGSWAGNRVICLSDSTSFWRAKGKKCWYRKKSERNRNVLTMRQPYHLIELVCTLCSVLFQHSSGLCHMVKAYLEGHYLVKVYVLEKLSFAYLSALILFKSEIWYGVCLKYKNEHEVFNQAKVLNNTFTIAPFHITNFENFGFLLYCLIFSFCHLITEKRKRL